MIAALILAGADARGIPEQWLALRGAGLDPLRIAIPRGGKAIAAASGLAGENFVPDRARSGSPLSALQSGLRALLGADDGWDAVVVQPASAPAPHPSVILALLTRLAEGDAGIVRPVHGRKAGFPLVLARQAAAALLAVNARRETLDGLLEALDGAGAVEGVEVYTSEVLAARPRRGKAR
ncbi:MAG TPA: NTP transferase domain-containing protein [Anaeromyxobacteraceae bacterium]|nr:NTP transferase domain-containing protein [Anaeromyxobacteraceae bacterium]